MGTELATAANYSLPDLQTMAKSVAESRLFAGAETPQAAFTLMLLCQAEGLHPIQAMRRYHVIKGRPTMRADAMQAEFQRAGGIIRWDASDNEQCYARFIHPTHAPDPGVGIGLTMNDAVAFGLTKNELYQKYPAQMLRARVISQGVRMVLPGIVVGIYTPEEIDTPDIDVTSTRVTQTRVEPVKEIESRADINTAFKPVGLPQAQAEPRTTSRANLETTAFEGDKLDVKGRDRRKWTDLFLEEVGASRDRVARMRRELGLDPEAKESFNIHSVTNHMIRMAIESGYRDPYTYDDMGKRKKAGPGMGGAYLEEVYRAGDEWREWARLELRQYLERKEVDAESLAQNEAHGDEPTEAERSSDVGEPVLVGSMNVPDNHPDSDVFPPGKE